MKEAPMVDFITYEFKPLNTGGIIPKESVVNSYAEEIYESEKVRTSTKVLRTILDYKY